MSLARYRPSSRSQSTAADLLDVARRLLGTEIGMRVRAWDGSESGPESADGAVVFRNRRALRRIIWAPNELGLARAFVSGDVDIEGDIIGTLDRPEIIQRLQKHWLSGLSPASALRALGTVLVLGGIGRPIPPPSTEIRHGRHRSLSRHSRAEDAQAISHHYDVGNAFYRLILGPSMVYSCGYWRHGREGDLDLAQTEKIDLICRKLALRSDSRLLDVGCGWGSLAIHAARYYAVNVVGVTLSAEQCALARERVAAAGVADLVQIRLQDYRDVIDGPFDAIASVGMSEHVGQSQLRGYTTHLMGLLRPGGRILNHAIATIRPAYSRNPLSPGFIERYIFPGGEISPLSLTVEAFEEAGAEVRDVEALREHYGLTLRAWVSNLRENWDQAVALVGSERARTWLLYLATTALAFERGRVTIHQVLAVKQSENGASNMDWTRTSWIQVDGGGLATPLEPSPTALSKPG